MTEAAMILTEVCAAIAADRVRDAADILVRQYPFIPLSNAGRRYPLTRCMALFARDGFLDRYSGRRLVFPGTLRLLSKFLPGQFPFHTNWKTDSCHFAFYELFPTVDHIVPISRGGENDVENLVTTSMLRNAAKANFTLEELGWSLQPPGDGTKWDGLTTWFFDQAHKTPELLADNYLRQWHAAATTVLRPHSRARM